MPKENKAILPDYNPGEESAKETYSSQGNTLNSAPWRWEKDWPLITALIRKTLRLIPCLKHLPSIGFIQWLRTPLVRHHLESHRLVQVGLRNISQVSISTSPIPLPPLHEQRRIAAILDKADAIRRKRQEALALTDEFLRSAFLEMFGDPVTNPKGWPVVKLEETFSLKPQIGTIVPAQEVGQQIVVRVGELGDYNVALERSKRVTLQGSELKRFELIPGDFLLARAIGSEEHLGKASVLQPVDQTVVFDSHVMRLRFKEKYLDPMFFLQWLRTDRREGSFHAQSWSDCCPVQY